MRSLIFRQLFEHLSSTYTYILGCSLTKEALILDPVIETVERDAQIIKQLHLKLKFIANTHVHADHVTGSGELKKMFPKSETVIAEVSNAKADLKVNHRDVLTFGTQNLEVRSTPGHTNGCLSFVSHAHKLAFTGDALLIRGCGRTDFQQDKSLPANMVCGVYELMDEKLRQLVEGAVKDYKK